MADEKDTPKAATPPPPQTIQEEAGLPENWQPVNSAPVNPNVRNFGGPPTASTGIDNFQSGQLPPFLGLSPDLVDAGTPGSGVPTDRLMPIAPGGVSQNVATVKSVAQPLIDAAIAKIPPPKIPASTANAFQLIENFTKTFFDASFTTPIEGIGELNWNLTGTTNEKGGILGGTFPNIGQFMWGNDNTVNHAGALLLGASGGVSPSTFIAAGWALGENPGWSLRWIFSLQGDWYDFGTTPFSTAQKSIYIGLCGITSRPQFANISPRPDVFIGLRYDTSTTAPSINDAFYTLEVVANHSFSTPARHNTQGVTLVTGTVPAVDGWHTLDISSTVAGQVTVTLDGSASLTTAIPTFTFTNGASATSGSITNNIATVGYTGGGAADPPQSPWGAGSQLLVSGFTSTEAIFNGAWPLLYSNGTNLSFNLVGSASGSSGTVSLSGYPALLPVFVGGNDDTASPTANNMFFLVDFFSFVWNPIS